VSPISPLAWFTKPKPLYTRQSTGLVRADPVTSYGHKYISKLYA